MSKTSLLRQDARELSLLAVESSLSSEIRPPAIPSPVLAQIIGEARRNLPPPNRHGRRSPLEEGKADETPVFGFD